MFVWILPGKSIESMHSKKKKKKKKEKKITKNRAIDNKLITKTYLYIFYPLKPQFYIVKFGFTGVYIIFSYFRSTI